MPTRYTVPLKALGKQIKMLSIISLQAFSSASCSILMASNNHSSTHRAGVTQSFRVEILAQIYITSEITKSHTVVILKDLSMNNEFECSGIHPFFLFDNLHQLWNGLTSVAFEEYIGNRIRQVCFFFVEFNDVGAIALGEGRNGVNR